MNAITRSLVLLALFAGIQAAAQELVLDAAEISNLGIEFIAPEPMTSATAVSAPARVVVPPSADHIVASSVAGLVERVYAGVGDRVTAGDPLLSIRSPGFLGLQQQYLEARAEASVAEAQLMRDEALFDDGIIARRRLEETRADAVAATTRSAEHARLLSIAGLRSSDIRALEHDGRLIDALTVRAPVDGVVLDVMTRAGENVEPVTTLCRVADLGTLWLEIRVPQQRVAGVTAGAGVSVRESAQAVTARVLAVGQAVDPETQTVLIRAAVTVDDHGLRPGQLVHASVLAATDASGDAVVSLPDAALMRSGSAVYVFSRSARGVAATPVSVVAPSGSRMLVRGLPAGAEVAVAGVSALKALWLAASEAED